MAPAPHRRPPPMSDGPYTIAPGDIGPLNQVFSDAFTERYRRDGMVGVRVPFLNPSIWRYAIEDAGEGAMLWRDEQGGIVAFNIAHLSGAEGWMGPLAVRPDVQEAGIGKRIVRAGMEWLESQGARTIGLETMPRTMDNIGFYSRLGFAPGRMTITLTLAAVPGERAPVLLGRLPVAERRARVAECRTLAQRLRAGSDFTREIELTDELSLGDTLLLLDDGELRGFALYHTAPLVEGRVRDELRVLKMALADQDDAAWLARELSDQARRSGTRQVAIRVQGEFGGFYERLVALGGRVRWTDLRMTLKGRPEAAAVDGAVVLSNWEI